MFARCLILLLSLAALALTFAVPRPSNGAGTEDRYIVRAGDTLWKLAVSRYDGDPREGVWLIRERNHLRGSALRPGAILYLPAEAGVA
jgi:hypothetical protein